MLLGSVFCVWFLGLPFFLSGACLKGMAYFGCWLLAVGLFFGVLIVAKNKRGEIQSLLEVQC